MNKELIDAYDKLDVIEKRNALSNELMIIGQMLSSVSHDLNLETDLTIKNYDSGDEEIDEGEVLTFFYEDVYNIKREVLQIFNYIRFKQNK